MKTKKQVIDAFVRLQKKYIDIRGFATVKAYKGVDAYWSVEISVAAFNDRDIAWRESIDWIHYSNHNDEDEARNVQAVEDFIQRIESRKGEIKWNTIEGLAHDLCDGFEDTFDERTMTRVIRQILSEGEYTLEDLWRMNNEDSNLVYDIISQYEPTKRDGLFLKNINNEKRGV